MKVECIKTFEYVRNTRRWGNDEIYPEVGMIYTVRLYRSGPAIAAYLLDEIRNPVREYSDSTDEPGFDCRHFRPVTDISVFTKFTKVRELEDA